MRVEEEGETGRKVIELQPGGQGCFNVRNAVSEREGHFLSSRRSRFTDVIAGDGNRVPVRNFLGAVGEGVNNESHRRTWWVDVRPTSDILLQDVVLNGSAELVARDALFFTDQLVHQQEG